MGLVLYPDDYAGEALSGTVTELPEGVVFLPAAGERNGETISGVGEYGLYWASDTAASYEAYNFQFTSDKVRFFSPEHNRGSCIRLVTDVK